MSAHTPGPWQAVEDEQHLLSPDQFRIWINAEGLHVAYVDGPRNVERVANARLTAAAPDLLAALQALVAELDGPGKPYSSDSYAPPHFIETAKAAIAKATNGDSK